MQAFRSKFSLTLDQRNWPKSHFCAVTLLAIAGLWMTACVHVDVNISSPNYDQDPGSFGETFEGQGPLSGHALTMLNHRQETGTWCWAASTQTVNEFIRKILHTELDQCQLVKQVLGTPVDCCLARRSVPLNTTGAAQARDICDNGLWPDEALGMIGLTFLKVPYSSPYDDLKGWQDLTWQIDQDLPYLAVLKWAGGGYHAVSIGGYGSSPDLGEFVHVYNPGQDAFRIMHFSDFYTGIHGRFTHKFDYFIFRPGPA